MEIGLYLGTFSAQKRNVSVINRIDGRGGKMYSFCAMYSLRMSFCSVPEIFFQSAPCFSATARYIARRIGEVEMIVIETVTYSWLISSQIVTILSSVFNTTQNLP